MLANEEQVTVVLAARNVLSPIHLYHKAEIIEDEYAKGYHLNEVLTRLSSKRRGLQSAMTYRFLHSSPAWYSVPARLADPQSSACRT